MKVATEINNSRIYNKSKRQSQNNEQYIIGKNEREKNERMKNFVMKEN